MAELSVIITAFNVEKYIKETLESVISQSLKNIEIIVVDDCSTDKTYDIITSFADKDSRIRVIRHEKNSSVSLARKHGIEAATGKYMMFLDGDDMLAKRACETALLAIELHKVDVLQFDTMLFTDSKEKISPEFENSLTLYLKSPQKKIVAPSDCGLIDADEVPHPINFTVWNKIYRAEIVKKAGKNIPDEHLNLADDVLMSYLIQFFAHSFISIPKKLHCYRIGSGITTTKQLSD